jgi:SAM-dependent methyltransferase
LIFLRVRVREEVVHAIYDAPYHSSRNLKHARWVGEKRLALLGDLPKDARIVEDGAGNGAFLRAALDHGFVARGCDLGLNSIEIAKSAFGVELVHGRLADLAIEPGSLDVVASFNLLSHLYEPWRYIESVAALLKPGGRWLCRTGDRSGFMGRVGHGDWSAPEHVFHFTARVLHEMAERANLRWRWQTPAFDSDFPYLFLRYGREGDTPLRRVLKRGSSLFIRGWSRLGLPKEDIYFIAERA